MFVYFFKPSCLLFPKKFKISLCNTSCIESKKSQNVNKEQQFQRTKKNFLWPELPLINHVLFFKVIQPLLLNLLLQLVGQVYEIDDSCLIFCFVFGIFYIGYYYINWQLSIVCSVQAAAAAIFSRLFDKSVGRGKSNLTEWRCFQLVLIQWLQI